MLERKPTSPWKFYPGAMWETWQPPESHLRFPSPISYNASGLVLFFCSNWKKTPDQHLGHKPVFSPDWCCPVKPGFLAKRGAIYLYICLFLHYLFILFYSNTGPYLRIAIIKYVHVTRRECYKYMYFFTTSSCPSYDLFQCLPPFLWNVEVNYNWNSPKAHVPVMNWDAAAPGVVETAAELWWELGAELAGGCRSETLWPGRMWCGLFRYQSLHLAVFFSTLSKKLNLKGNVRKQPG